MRRLRRSATRAGGIRIVRPRSIGSADIACLPRDQDESPGISPAGTLACDGRGHRDWSVDLMCGATVRASHAGLAWAQHERAADDVGTASICIYGQPGRLRASVRSGLGRSSIPHSPSGIWRRGAGRPAASSVSARRKTCLLGDHDRRPAGVQAVLRRQGGAHLRLPVEGQVALLRNLTAIISARRVARQALEWPSSNAPIVVVSSACSGACG